MSPSGGGAPVGRPAENWARRETMRKPSTAPPGAFPPGPRCARANTRPARTPPGGSTFHPPCNMRCHDAPKSTGPPVGSTSAGRRHCSLPGVLPRRMARHAAVVGSRPPAADPALAVSVHPPRSTPKPASGRGSGLHVHSPGQGLANPRPRSSPREGGAAGARCFRKRENRSSRGRRRSSGGGGSRFAGGEAPTGGRGGR